MRLGLRLTRWRPILALIYLAAMAVLVFKIASPVNIQIVIEGEQEIHVREISNVYTFTDVCAIMIAAVAMASTGLSLIFPGMMGLEAKLGSLEPKVKSLSKNEGSIYSLVKEKGGVLFQSEIVEALGLPKSTVSITLDRLEAKGLIEKRKRGMSNVIVARHEKPIR